MSMRLLWVVLAVAVLAGIAFRAERIERLQFRGDETATALRVSGHTNAEVLALFNGNVYSLQQLQRFQQVDPHEPFAATVTGLASEEPQHPPLFYVADRAWATIAGSSIASLRTPALIFSLIAIAATYWLCFELTTNPIVGGAGAALMAVSPFFVDYGAQAREYSLWAAMVAATSALLVRAVRVQQPAVWFAYAVLMALALYSDFLMLWVLLAHAIFVLACYRRTPRVMPWFLIAAAIALIAYGPWLIVVWNGHAAIAHDQAWTKLTVPLRGYVQRWAFDLGSVLFDAEWDAPKRFLVFEAVALIVIAYSCYRVVRDEPRTTTWLLGALAGAITLPQFLLDIATHSHTSIVARYLVPLWLVLLVCVALFFGRRLAELDNRMSARWLAAFCALLIFAGASSAAASAATVWWDNHDAPTETMARRINEVSAPLVLSDGPAALIFPLTYYVAPDTRFLLYRGAPPFPLSQDRDAFVVGVKQSASAFRSHPQYRLQPVVAEFGGAVLFRIYDAHDRT